MNTKEVVDNAIEHCIENGVLADFLQTHRDEVAEVTLLELELESYIALEKEKSRKENP